MSGWTTFRNDLEKIALPAAGVAAGIFAPELIPAIGDAFGIGAATDLSAAGLSSAAGLGTAGFDLGATTGAFGAGTGLGAGVAGGGLDAASASLAAAGAGAGAGTAAYDLSAIPSIAGDAGVGAASLATPMNWLPPTGSGAGVQPLPTSLQSLAGAQAPMGAPTLPGLSVGGNPLDAAASPMSYGATDPTAIPDQWGGPPTANAAPGAKPGMLDQFGNWISQPKNLATAGLTGMSMLTGLHQPKLPGAAQTALNAASPAVTQAQSVISSGGTATPVWQAQKTSIDSMVDQQTQQAVEAMKQSAASSGMGGNDSMVVQQKIAQIMQQATTQKQALYAQAMQQNVQNAVNELSGGNATLGSIANMQMAQSDQARAAAGQMAEVALLLNKGG